MKKPNRANFSHSKFESISVAQAKESQSRMDDVSVCDDDFSDIDLEGINFEDECIEDKREELAINRTTQS